MIDGDSVPVRAATRAFPQVVQLGRITTCKVYGNLPRVGRQCWRAAAAEYPGLPAPRFLHATGSNAADFELSMDAANVSRADFEGVCLMSCDGDLAHAVQRLRNSGLTVHVFGRAQTARALQRAASRFHLIEFPARAVWAAAAHGTGADAASRT
jgi:hypothetical protein